ncbi:cytochrome P450 3A29-like [Macrobrachium rosenbergii]|uniref:cytochrome P450 3A29-like n=1 Tax=Macrobrachium rosenbergii TaxID=79674 RepID=UPI0034D69A1A
MDGLFGWLHLDLATSTWTTLVFVTTLIGIVIIERWWHMGKLERLGYTGPPKNFLFGNLKEMARMNSNFQDGWKEIIDKYGSQVGNLEGKSMAIYSGRVPCIVVTNPEVIKYVGIRGFDKFRNRPFSRLVRSKNLLSLRDDRWRSVRHTLTPTFSQAKMKLMSQAINDAVSVTLEIIEDHIKQNKPTDFYGLYHGLTLEVIGKCALAINVESQRNPDHPLLQKCKEIFKTFKVNSFNRVLGTLFPSLVIYLRRYLGRFFSERSRHDKKLKVDILEVIENRKNVPVGRTVDALQLMLEAAQLVSSEEVEKNSPKDDSNANLSNGKEEGVGKRPQNVKELDKREPKMTEDEVADNAIVFLLAGYETTSTMLSYTTYLLAKHPDVQQRLYEEIVQHLNEEEEVTYDMINELEYLDMVMNESLRFYPPIASSISREVDEDCEFEGLKFPAGASVFFPIAYMHYNEHFWPNPKTFDPERFHPSKRRDIHVASFLPFGLGPRNCIGFRFAFMEGKIALARLLRRYCIQMCDLTEEEIKMKAANISLTPESGHIYLRCVHR